LTDRLIKQTAVFAVTRLYHFGGVRGQDQQLSNVNNYKIISNRWTA
jgi:hypothetical protein